MTIERAKKFNPFSRKLAVSSNTQAYISETVVKADVEFNKRWYPDGLYVSSFNNFYDRPAKRHELLEIISDLKEIASRKKLKYIYFHPTNPLITRLAAKLGSEIFKAEDTITLYLSNGKKEKTKCNLYRLEASKLKL
jgi:hypothetical protein